MYYLNDKHLKYEYDVYIQTNNGKPYILGRRFATIDDVYRYTKEIEKKHNHYNQSFYIDNDFYKNEYDKKTVKVYYKFLRRKINDWEEFDKKKKIELDTDELLKTLLLEHLKTLS
jgi:hypothetical protein